MVRSVADLAREAAGFGIVFDSQKLTALTRVASSGSDPKKREHRDAVSTNATEIIGDENESHDLLSKALCKVLESFLERMKQKDELLTEAHGDAVRLKQDLALLSVENRALKDKLTHAEKIEKIKEAQLSALHSTCVTTRRELHSTKMGSSNQIKDLSVELGKTKARLIQTTSELLAVQKILSESTKRGAGTTPCGSLGSSFISGNYPEGNVSSRGPLGSGRKQQQPQYGLHSEQLDMVDIDFARKSIVTNRTPNWARAAEESDGDEKSPGASSSKEFKEPRMRPAVKRVAESDRADRFKSPSLETGGSAIVRTTESNRGMAQGTPTVDPECIMSDLLQSMELEEDISVHEEGNEDAAGSHSKFPSYESSRFRPSFDLYENRELYSEKSRDLRGG